MKFVPSTESLPLAALLAVIPLTSALAHTGTACRSASRAAFSIRSPGSTISSPWLRSAFWGAQLGNPAIWILPITFPLVMAMGGLIGLTGVDLPLIEPVIALSGIALGLLIALYVRPPALDRRA